MFYWKVKNVFDVPQVNWINDQIDRSWRVFTPAEVATNDKDWRSANNVDVGVLPHIGEMFLPKLKEYISTAFKKLEITEIVGRIETQITISCNGDYYKVHSDTDKDTRVLSYVYYLHNTPKKFRGGQLRIYPFGEGEEFIDITPEYNSMVFFRSETDHEVLPVTSSGKFQDTRRTINGWIHKQKRQNRGRKRN